MTKETIFSAYEPIERYLHYAETTDALAVQPVDALLLRLLSSFHEHAPMVVDLAADATGGATAALWASNHPRYALKTVIPAVSGASNGWRAGWPDAARALGFAADAVTLSEESIDTPGAWERLNPARTYRGPLFITAAFPADPQTTAAALRERLCALFDLHPRAVIFALPAGPAGNPALARAAQDLADAPDAQWNSLTPRDLSPYFAFSQMIIAHRRDDNALPEALSRIVTLYEGNYTPLELLRAHFDLMLQNKQLKAQIDEARWMREEAIEARRRLEGQLSQLGAGAPAAPSNNTALVPATPREPVPDSVPLPLRGMFRAARGTYRGFVPLRTRLRLRDTRRRLLGRVNRP